MSDANILNKYNDWTDLRLEPIEKLGILTMSGCYQGVRYEESLNLTNFEMAAIEQGEHGRVERVVVRLMDKLRNKPDGN